MVAVKLEGINLSLNDVKILENITWEIEEGELMVLVGPSGCGKTTLLKVILGSLTPETGKIFFNDKLINEIPLSKRNIGFVPQNFGLFPHLNVIENITYGLKMQNVSKSNLQVQEAKYIAMLRLQNLELRTPNQLSWGQQQRVALARALAIEPTLLLLDEPLSSVDWNTRKDITEEIYKMQKNLKITTIYVTHDINEAFEIGDRITVMSAGKIEQCDRPEILINNPLNNFVSSYISKNQNLKRLKAHNETKLN
ncbi:MAG: ABC transporter ATP-binding protein [Candidatus Hermodarchaeota archaeon]